jgi:uncharacterized protein (DUF4213/DUF364 family)
MTNKELFETLREKMKTIVEERQLFDKEIKISCRALTPEEAIGVQERKDLPILAGKEVMIQAEFDGGIGQAFTSAPTMYTGTLNDVLNLDIVENEYDRAIFIASLNAITRKCALCDRSIHCRDHGPKDCAQKAMEFLKIIYGSNRKIAQIGYQPFLLEQLSKNFEQVRVLDLNPDNVGDVRFGIKVLDGIKDYDETVLEWADLILCTSSTLCNGSIVNFLDIGKEVLFYGTTGAGAAELMGWKRLCFAD